MVKICVNENEDPITLFHKNKLRSLFETFDFDKAFYDENN